MEEGLTPEQESGHTQNSGFFDGSLLPDMKVEDVVDLSDWDFY